jgi:hydrogenase maturation protease
LTGDTQKILIYGYGNPGRQDDGLGVMLAEEIERWSAEKGFVNIHTDSNYQLNLEDADTLARHDLVIFADASRKDIDTFIMEPLKASEKSEFTMHSVSPAFVLHLSRQAFNREPEAFLMHIKGYEWEFMGEMSEKARKNLNLAANYLKNYLIENSK